MKVATLAMKIKGVISQGLGTQHPVKLVAGLGLGAVLMAGTAPHLVPNSNNESGGAVSSDQQRVLERREEAQSIISWLNHSKPARASYERQRAADSFQERLEVQRVQEDLQNYRRGVSSPSYHQQRAADSVEERLEVQRLLQEGSTHQFKRFNYGNSLIERLERQIDNLLADVARNPSRNTPQLNREIERLDYQINMMRLALMAER